MLLQDCPKRISPARSAAIHPIDQHPLLASYITSVLMVYSTIIEEVIARLCLSIQEDHSSLVISWTGGGSGFGTISCSYTLCSSYLVKNFVKKYSPFIIQKSSRLKTFILTYESISH